MSARKTIGQPGYRFWWLRVVSDDNRLSPTARNLARVLGLYLNDRGTCWARQTELLADMGLKARALQNAATELQDAGYITRELGHRRKTTEYTAVLPQNLSQRSVDRINGKGASDCTQTDDDDNERVHDAAPKQAERVHLRTERVQSGAPLTTSEPSSCEPTYKDRYTTAETETDRTEETETERTDVAAWLNMVLRNLHPLAYDAWGHDWSIKIQQNPDVRTELIDEIRKIWHNPMGLNRLRDELLADNDVTTWERTLKTRAMERKPLVVKRKAVCDHEGRPVMIEVATRGNLASILIKRLYNVVKGYDGIETSQPVAPTPAASSAGLDHIANLTASFNKRRLDLAS